MLAGTLNVGGVGHEGFRFAVEGEDVGAAVDESVDLGIVDDGIFLGEEERGRNRRRLCE